mmetsp:Transcript_9229/g.24243  ORF Transcript_9229/g.24243 Transcript_9229/m.24243 type:complete len:239 (-) Transcript_9229:551-1267(-)
MHSHGHRRGPICLRLVCITLRFKQQAQGSVVFCLDCKEDGGIDARRYGVHGSTCLEKKPQSTETVLHGSDKHGRGTICQGLVHIHPRLQQNIQRRNAVVFDCCEQRRAANIRSRITVHVSREHRRAAGIRSAIHVRFHLKEQVQSARAVFLRGPREQGGVDGTCRAWAGVHVQQHFQCIHAVVVYRVDECAEAAIRLVTVRTLPENKRQGIAVIPPHRVDEGWATTIPSTVDLRVCLQ